MIKLVRFLTNYRNLVFVILISPIFSVFFADRFSPQIIPDSPYPEYDIEFLVPSRSAEEISQRVTIPAEKIFNGLPELLSMSSETVHGKAIINLVFSEKLNDNNSFLYIQEKMDRIRFAIPRDVESVQVKAKKMPLPPDLYFHFNEGLSVGNFFNSISNFKSSILKSEPSFDELIKISVQLEPKKLFRFGLSVSEVVNALKSVGLSTSIGRKDQIKFETGSNFESIEELESTVVAARGHRVIRLIDVSKIDFEVNQAVKEFSLWLDQKQISLNQVKSQVQSKFPEVEIEYPYWKMVWEQSRQPILALILIIFLQLIIMRYLFGPSFKKITVGMFNILTIVHFIFWKSLLFGAVTILDFHALVFSIIIGSMFWIILFSRTRSFFLQENIIKKTPKTLEQAALFSIGELVPTFLVLIIVMWLFQLPIIL